MIACMNSLENAFAGAVLPVLAFQQVDAPTFRKGFPTTFGLTAASIACVVVTQGFVVREQRAKRRLSLLEATRSRDPAIEMRTLDAKGREPENVQEPLGGPV